MELLIIHYKYLMAAFLAFAISYLSIPTIVNVARLKGLFDEPDSRKSHKAVVPTLGGLAIFLSIVFSLSIFDFNSANYKFFVAACLILLMIGLKDDILIISPVKKLMGEIMSILILIVFADVRLSNFHGFLGINEIGYFSSVCLTIFVGVVIINSLNLIDGIDGLASGVGMVIVLTFGIWFTIAGYPYYSVLSFITFGALGGFFIRNVYGKENKIFMGDTGSLIIGLTVSLLTVKFNEANAIATVKDSWFYIQSAPAVSFGILIVPLFDTIRVFTLRALKGKSPFTPDKKHVHHRLLDLGFKHIQATSIIVFINVIFVITAILLGQLGILILMAINLALAAMFSYIPVYLVRKKNRKVNREFVQKIFVFSRVRKSKKKKKKLQSVEVQE